MPDTRLIWKNLKEHLRKYGAWYLVGLGITLFLVNLLWTVTTPRIPGSQSVVVMMADNYSNSEMLDDIAARMLQEGRAHDDTLRTVEFQSLMYNRPEQDYSGIMVLTTRVANFEGDAFLASADAMAALIQMGVLEPLDNYVAAGWMANRGLEPYYATVTDEDTGETTTYLAGLRLDSVDALYDRGAFNNEGAYLAVTSYGENIDTTLATMETMIDALIDEGAGKEAQP